MKNAAAYILAVPFALAIAGALYALLTLALQYGLEAGFGKRVEFWPLFAIVFVFVIGALTGQGWKGSKK